MLENLIAMGLETQARVLEFGWVVPSADVAAAMGVPADAQVQRAVRVRSTDGGPFSHLTTYVPERVGRSIAAEDLGAHPLLTLLERSGVRVASADQTIGATLADAQAAMRLGVDVGSALLTLTRAVRDEAGQVVEYLQALYRPDRYLYRMSLARVDAAEGGRVWTPWAPTADAGGRRRRAPARRGGGRGA
jgi:GntR family transcriptional regulator